ncbi:hypothetical protein JCM3774_003424 [Rhodotorula dairenensis]
MSDRYSASTPPSRSASSAPSSRHLKRLSLSGSAFSPVSSPVQHAAAAPAASSDTTAASPLTGRTAQSVAASHSPAPGAGHSPSALLRRSTSYRAAASTASPVSAGASASPAGTSAGVCFAAATNSTTPDSRSAPAQPPNSERASHPTPTRSGSAVRVRRGASISYTGGSTTPTRLSLDGERPARASLDTSTTTGPPAAPPLADVPETDSLPVPSAESHAHTLIQHSPVLSAASGSTASAAPPAPATLLEQNADLLSIIAKKERKCLDLREELKRNEADLATLKNKWQAIVARSLQAQAYQPYVPSQHRSSPSIATTASTASPNTSPTPRPALLPHATHSLDLSLLSSTFEPADYNLDGITPPGAGGRLGHGGDASPMEIPESVKAAGTWLGGALGRVLEAAVGMPPPLDEKDDQYEGSRRRGDDDVYDWSSMTGPQRETTTGLGIVNEEEEEDGEGEGEVTSKIPGRTSATMSSGLGSSLRAPSSPKVIRSARSPPSPASGTASPVPLSPSSLSPSSAGTSPTHSRSRSAFSGLLSDKLTSRWAALSSSEVVQSSKRATLGLVDTFEQGLAHALGPLEPPPLPPFEQQQQRERRRGATGDERHRDGDALYAPAQQARTRDDDAARAAARRLPMPGATPGQGFASLFAAASSTSPRPADHFTAADKPTLA